MPIALCVSIYLYLSLSVGQPPRWTERSFAACAKSSCVLVSLDVVGPSHQKATCSAQKLFAATCQHVENGRSLPREYQKSRKTRSWKEERTEGKKQKRVRATLSVLQPSSLQQAKERRHILPETDNVTFMHQEDEAQLEMLAATSI